jgi:hypothetical protein
MPLAGECLEVDGEFFVHVGHDQYLGSARPCGRAVARTTMTQDDPTRMS